MFVLEIRLKVPEPIIERIFTMQICALNPLGMHIFETLTLLLLLFSSRWFYMIVFGEDLLAADLDKRLMTLS